MARETWTDERLDDLNARISEGFREQREETRTLRAEMNARFEAVDGRFDALNARFDAMQRLMISALLLLALGFIADKVV